jgi:hypothetical protein
MKSDRKKALEKQERKSSGYPELIKKLLAVVVIIAVAAVCGVLIYSKTL